MIFSQKSAKNTVNFADFLFFKEKMLDNYFIWMYGTTRFIKHEKTERDEHDAATCKMQKHSGNCN